VYEPPDPPTRDSRPADEAARVAGVYARYARSRRARRRWDGANPGNTAIRAELADAVWSMAGSELGAASEILDVGCGSGRWLAELAEDHRVSGDLRGVDVLAARVRAARERLGERAQIAIADARRLPFADSGFGIVTLFTVLSSLSCAADVELALREALRVLRPGGVLLIWEPRVPNPLNPNTLFVSHRLLRAALGDASVQVRTTTLVPALARRLGPRTPSAYPRLVRVGALRTHRLVTVRAYSASLGVSERPDATAQEAREHHTRPASPPGRPATSEASARSGRARPRSPRA
jgi:ubiquinone/menaquinone biosynthesis C-methylase UbiE